MQTFNEMLDDVYSQLGTFKSDIFILPKPELIKDTTRVIWKNIKTFLKRTHTPPEHIEKFISQETGKKINFTAPKVGTLTAQQAIQNQVSSGNVQKQVDGTYLVIKSFNYNGIQYNAGDVIVKVI